MPLIKIEILLDFCWTKQETYASLKREDRKRERKVAKTLAHGVRYIEDDESRYHRGKVAPGAGKWRRRSCLRPEIQKIQKRGRVLLAPSQIWSRLRLRGCSEFITWVLNLGRKALYENSLRGSKPVIYRILVTLLNCSGRGFPLSASATFEVGRVLFF